MYGCPCYRQHQLDGIIELLAEGRALKEGADLLHVTARTEAFHKYTIMGTST